MKRLFFIIITACCVLQAKAQQESQYSMYMLNTVAINPAYAGTREALNLTFLNRTQWISYPGAPVTQTISAHSPVFNESLSMGMTFVNDRIGPLRNNGLFVDVAYKLRFEKSKLSFGVKAGGDLVRADFTRLHTTQDNDPSFNQNMNSGILPNFGTGIYYYSDNYYLGFSIPRALSNRLFDLRNQNRTQEARQVMHYYLIGGYVIPINDNIKFKPSFQSKFAPGTPLQVDLNSSFLINERLWLGGFYRLRDAVGFMVQFNFTDQLRGAVAWDQTISKLAAHSNGSFELGLTYDFNFRNENIRSPRYF